MPYRRGRKPGYRPNGPEIKRLRVWVHKLSAAELAARIGSHAESIRAAEREPGRPISDVFAARLADALGVEVEDIATPPGDEPEALASLDAKKGPPQQRGARDH